MGVGGAFVPEPIGTVWSWRCGGSGGSSDCVFVVVCGVGRISPLCIVPESENSDFRAGVEGRGIHICFVAGAKCIAGDFRVAGGIWGHVYRGYGGICGLEACGAGASRDIHFLAGAWNIGPCYGGEPGHDGAFARSVRRVDGNDDGAAVEPDSNFFCAAVYDAACDLYRAGAELEDGIAGRAPSREAIATLGDLVCVAR